MSDDDHTQPGRGAGVSPDERELLTLGFDELTALAGLLALYHATAPDDDLAAVEAVSRSVNRRLFPPGATA